jgi:hypothetical protein
VFCFFGVNVPIVITETPKQINSKPLESVAQAVIKELFGSAKVGEFPDFTAKDAKFVLVKLSKANRRYWCQDWISISQNRTCSCC